MSDKRFANPEESDQAILDYLDDLLRPATGESATAEAIDNSPEIRETAGHNPDDMVEQGPIPPAVKAAVSESENADREPEEDEEAFETMQNSAASLLGRARNEWLAQKPVSKASVSMPLFSEPEPPKIQFSAHLKIKESPTAEIKPAALKANIDVAASAAKIVGRQKIDTPVTTEAEVTAKRQPEPSIIAPPAEGKETASDKADQQVPEVTADSVLDTGIPEGHWPNGRPAWAQERFECLLFHVAGLKLAVPLVSLGGIHALDEELTPLFGMPKWFLGLFPHGEVNIKVVDSALWVMPERYTADWLNHLKYVVRLHDSEWGLGCDNIAEAFTLDPNDVKWRGERSKRPWLAGTVVNHMCALIDVSGFRTLLEQSQAKNKVR